MILTLLLGLVINLCAVNAQLPCDSFLRVVRPELFTHCSSCFYNSWSSWTRTGSPMRNTNCRLTNRSFKEKRSRADSQGKCKVETEYRTTCEPTLEQKAKLLIAALNLGSPAITLTSSITQFLIVNTTSPISRRSISAICGTPSFEICKQRTGKSLQRDAAKSSVDEVVATEKLMDEYSIPNSFDFDGHLSAITTHYNKRQANSKKRYVLFILDSSGSIRSPQFTLMKEVLSKLLPLFCGNAIFGVMSYGAILQRDICFNCDQSDRYKFHQALRSIKFHNGGATRSGDAIRCACDYMLSKNCGYFNETNSITDVIFLTDGHSNRGENVCTATNCIPNGVNVVSIGVGYNIDYDELECIEGDNGANSHIFDVNDLAGLKQLQLKVVSSLIASKKICKNI